jgi:hypothetical protein
MLLAKTNLWTCFFCRTCISSHSNFRPRMDNTKDRYADLPQTARPRGAKSRSRILKFTAWYSDIGTGKGCTALFSGYQTQSLVLIRALACSVTPGRLRRRLGFRKGLKKLFLLCKVVELETSRHFVCLYKVLYR